MKKLKGYREEYLALQQGEPTVKVFPEDQSCEACLKAVKHNGEALQYVESQTEEICLKAVKHTGEALKYVEERFFN